MVNVPAVYPPANTTAQKRTAGGGKITKVEKLVLHTTETSGWPSYPSFAPHLTFDPWKLQWRQHMPLTSSASTLADSSSTAVRENRDGAIQIEIVAYCDPKLNKPGKGIDFLSDDAVRELARFAAWLHANGGLELKLAPGWLRYPDSYGKTKNRMTGPQYDAFQGILGHEHVSSNDHGDPGNPPWLSTFLAMAKDLSGATPVPSAPAGKELGHIMEGTDVKSLSRIVKLDQPLKPGENEVWLTSKTDAKTKKVSHDYTLAFGPSEGVDARAVPTVVDALGNELVGVKSFFRVRSYKEGTTTTTVSSGTPVVGTATFADDLPKLSDGRSARLRYVVLVPENVQGAVLKQADFSGWELEDK